MNIQETKVIYKTEGVGKLALHLFIPQDVADSRGKRAVIVFFHGGRFIQGHPAQFYPHCRYFASRGMVAASAEYRLLRKAATSIRDCLADSRAAIRWLRAHADEFAIDPAQVVAAGGSAGANLAANAAMADSREDVDEDLAMRARPDALILFSPAIIRPISEKDLIDERLYTQLAAKPHLPPMLLFHGTEDEFFSADRLKQFCEQLVAMGNACELRLFQGGKHGFFNYGRDENHPFFETVLAADRFLGKLDILDNNPTLKYDVLESLRHEGDWRS